MLCVCVYIARAQKNEDIVVFEETFFLTALLVSVGGF